MMFKNFAAAIVLALGLTAQQATALNVASQALAADADCEYWCEYDFEEYEDADAAKEA